MIFVIGSVFLNAVAQVFMKMASSKGLGLRESLVNYPLIAAGIIYLVSIFLWLKGLSEMPLSQAYPFQSLGYILVFISSYFVLGETIRTWQLIGLITICMGITILGISR
jgi:multidrug transporter EmrE-like cation transporter